MSYDEGVISYDLETSTATGDLRSAVDEVTNSQSALEDARSAAPGYGSGIAVPTDSTISDAVSAANDALAKWEEAAAGARTQSAAATATAKALSDQAAASAGC